MKAPIPNTEKTNQFEDDKILGKKLVEEVVLFTVLVIIVTGFIFVAGSQ